LHVIDDRGFTSPFGFDLFVGVQWGIFRDLFLLKQRRRS
jgi:hypothetical protein